jgi:hypothetical protein
MLLTRIKRGVVRASLLAQHNLAQNRFRIPALAWRPARAVLLSAVVLRTALMPVPLAAPATVLAAGSDDTDPSPRLVRVSVEANQALQLTRTGDLTTLTIATPVLQDVTIGISAAQERAAAEAARLEEERKVAEAARIEAAKKAAKKAATQRVLAVTPTVSPTAYGDGEVQNIIRAAAAQYNVNADLMLRIAKCESGFNPASKNRHSAASGLFQFMLSTYRNSPSGAAGLSIWDAKANAEAAAFKIANGALRAWNASKSCWNR